MLKTDLLNIIADLKNRRPTAVGDDDPITDKNYNDVVYSITKITEALELLNTADPNIPPVGSKYIRFPGDPEPKERYQHPTAKWINVSSKFPGDFLRIEGGNAAVFPTRTVSGKRAVLKWMRFRNIHIPTEFVPVKSATVLPDSIVPVITMNGLNRVEQMELAKQVKQDLKI